MKNPVIGMPFFGTQRRNLDELVRCQAENEALKAGIKDRAYVEVAEKIVRATMEISQAYWQPPRDVFDMLMKAIYAEQGGHQPIGDLWGIDLSHLSDGVSADKDTP